MLEFTKEKDYLREEYVKMCTDMRIYKDLISKLTLIEA